MRILVEILHPAHVHFFRHAIGHWQARGDEVSVLSREKDVAIQLLDAYGIQHTSLSRLGPAKWQLAIEMLVRDARMLRHCLFQRPDVLVGIMGVTIAQVGKLIGRPAIVFYDTENATLTNRFVYPLAHSVCTPECYQGPVWGRHVTYPGYHELAYLHPSRFTPDASVVKRRGIDPDSAYFLLRFVSWQASHDVGETGFDRRAQRRLIEVLKQHGRVLISSEQPLPPDLEEYRFSAPAHEMHHFLAHAKLLVGESATMASEAAVLGVPAVYIADTGRGYTDEQQQRYQLVKNFNNHQHDEALLHVQALLADEHTHARAQEQRKQLLSERIDTTAWIVSYVDRVVDEREGGKPGSGRQDP